MPFYANSSCACRKRVTTDAAEALAAECGKAATDRTCLPGIKQVRLKLRAYSCGTSLSLFARCLALYTSCKVVEQVHRSCVSLRVPHSVSVQRQLRREGTNSSSPDLQPDRAHLTASKSDVSVCPRLPLPRHVKDVAALSPMLTGWQGSKMHVDRLSAVRLGCHSLS